jgi:hypothetical protein
MRGNSLIWGGEGGSAGLKWENRRCVEDSVGESLLIDVRVLDIPLSRTIALSGQVIHRWHTYRLLFPIMIIYLLVETQTTDQSKNFFARLTQLSRFRDIPGSLHISARDVCPTCLPFGLGSGRHQLLLTQLHLQHAWTDQQWRRGRTFIVV